ncbi:hypothetical protein [Cellulophaga sp. BC115SP]|uniref:AAA family ATPase n=1 Tax=Cellulophaga sp. BC115SP TaxID=2683263 RepID=UPI001411F421|nr:hypothetical protein [Cellulophaga sp. BC115SP]NBB26763.1 hypothetical protein [Cellulophaga sp. BC115SP]
MSQHKITTKKGYEGSEVISALQKCIRRGLEREALFWAVELYDSGYGEWCFKRLRIMSSEDIGLAEPHISSEIWALYEMYREQAKKKDDKNEPQRLFLTHAVIKLCRAKKSRLIDWALIWAWLTHPFRRIQVPDVALDKHTERGRRLGRGFGHFFEEGTQLKPHEPQLCEEAYRDLAKDAIESKGGGLKLF